MSSLTSLPHELIVPIVAHLESLRDIASLSRTCSAAYGPANDELYKRSRQLHGQILCWAAESGRLGTVQKLLEVGADPNCPCIRVEYRDESSDLVTEERMGRSSVPEWGEPLHNVYRHLRQSWEPEIRQHASRERRDREMFEQSGDGLSSNRGVWLTESAPFRPWGWTKDEPVFPSLNLDKPQADERDKDEYYNYYSDSDESESDELTITDRWYPLHLAVKGGHDQIAELLLDEGADINAIALGACICERSMLDFSDRDMFNEYDCRWEGGVERRVQERNPFSVTALHVALCHRQHDTAMMLLRRGSVRSFDAPRWKSHVIHTAAAFGCLDIVQFLLQGDDAVDINVQDSRGLTPLYYAYSTRQRETMLWLIDNGADVDAELGCGVTLLHLACVEGAFAVAMRLVDAGADVNRSWNERVCRYPGRLRPLELCCVLHYAKTRRVYASDAVAHERKFERRRLELMNRLLDAGARLDPIPKPSPQPDEHRVYPQASAVTLAASHHSVPMLELLASRGADMAKEASAIHQAIYPAGMEWKEPPNPVPTLQWLVAHGVPVECDSAMASDALAFVCGLPAGNPWKHDVLEWLIQRGVRPDLQGRFYGTATRERLHPIDTGPCEVYGYPTCALLEALLARDFDTCRILMNSHPRPSAVMAFSHLLYNVEDQGRVKYFPSAVGNEQQEKTIGENGEVMEFLLSEDKEEMIKNAPRAFLNLVQATAIPPCKILLDAPLPMNARLCEEAAVPISDHLIYHDPERLVLIKKQMALFCELRRRLESAETLRYWDLTSRLAVVIAIGNWNAAHFLLQHASDTSWAEEEGMAYFASTLRALHLAPEPNIIGRLKYQRLLDDWDAQEDQGCDLRTAMLHAACRQSIDLEPLLTHPRVDINATNAKGETALHALAGTMLYERDSDELYPFTERLLQLLGAGADPRAGAEPVRGGISRLFDSDRFYPGSDDEKMPSVKEHWTDVVDGVDDPGISVGYEITVRLRGVEERFVFD